MSNFPSETPFAPYPIPQSPLQQPPRSKGGSWIIGLLLVGLGVFTLGGILCVAGIWYVANNLDRWLVGIGREAIVAMIDESEIPAAEKTEVITQVDRVVNAYKERKIGLEDLEKSLAKLEEAPALKVLPLYGLDELYLTGAGLTEKEIEEGRRLYQRALRGVYEGKFTEDDLYAALPGEANLNANLDNASDPKDLQDQITLVADDSQGPISADDIRESLVKLKVMADNARIPNEPFQLDIGDEVRKLVDELLAGKE